MSSDPMQEFKEAESEIAARKTGRDASLPEFRKVAALEQIADELLLLRMEVRMTRYAIASAAARRG